MTDQKASDTAFSRLSRRQLLHAGGVGAAGMALAGAAAPGAASAAMPPVEAGFKDFALPEIAGGDASLETVLKKGKLVVASSNSWPFSFMDESGKTWKGIDADIIRFVAKMLKIPVVEAQTVSWDGLVPGVQASRFDMVGDSIMYTASRAQVVSFCFPTYYYAEALVVAKGNPKKLSSLEDLTGHKVGTLLGSNYAEWLAEVPGVAVETYQDWVQMLPELANGRLEAVIYDQPVMAASIKDHPEWPVELVAAYKPRSVRNPNAYSRYAFRQADIQLVTAFSAAIEWMQYNGEMQKILAAWGLGDDNN